jgi:hypothetical protein
MAADAGAEGAGGVAGECAEGVNDEPDEDEFEPMAKGGGGRVGS